MADRLTQLQDGIDDYLIQCFAGLNYNFHHHPYADIPNQPSHAVPTVSLPDPEPATATETTSAEKLTNGHASTTQKTQQSASQSQSQKPTEKKNDKNGDEPPKEDEPSDQPHSAAEHTASLRELAQGLVLKEQQIEYLIQSLPGIGSSESDQERRIRELQEELRAVEAERKEKEVVRESLVEGLGAWLVGGRRVP